MNTAIQFRAVLTKRPEVKCLSVRFYSLLNVIVLLHF